MRPQQKQLRGEIVMSLMLTAALTAQELSTKLSFDLVRIRSNVTALKRHGVIEESVLDKRDRGRPLTLTPKAMESVMTHVKKDLKRSEAIALMLEEFSSGSLS